MEAFIDFFKQLLAFYATPSLETPSYTILRWAPAVLRCTAGGMPHVASCTMDRGPVQGGGHRVEARSRIGGIAFCWVHGHAAADMPAAAAAVAAAAGACGCA